MSRVEPSERVNCSTMPSTGCAANFWGIRYQGMAVSSTVWTQKMNSERRPMAWMAWVTTFSTLRWNQMTMERMPRPVTASSRMLTGPRVHSAIETT